MKKEQAKQLRSMRPELQRIIVDHVSQHGHIDFATPKANQKPVDIGLFEILKTKDQLNLFENDRAST